MTNEAGKIVAATLFGTSRIRGRLDEFLTPRIRQESKSIICGVLGKQRNRPSCQRCQTSIRTDTEGRDVRSVRWWHQCTRLWSGSNAGHTCCLEEVAAQGRGNGHRQPRPSSSDWSARNGSGMARVIPSASQTESNPQSSIFLQSSPKRRESPTGTLT